MAVLTKPSLALLKVRKVKSATSWSVLTIWVLLSVFVAIMSSLGFLQPSWIVMLENRDKDYVESVSLGVYSYCYRLEHLEDVICRLYGAAMDFRKYPSEAWQATCVLYGSGCIFLICCALIAVICLGLPTDKWRQRVAIAVGHTQAAGVLILIVALLIYPFGLGSSFVRQHCGASATVFNSDKCSLGWSYMLAIMSTILSLYCPVLAKFSTYKVYEPDYWTYCSNNI